MRAIDTIVFTDLDGTLLDPRNYSWAAAQDALDEIERRRVPLVFCTSKTRAEVEVLRRELGNVHPFITENGGGIFIPYGYFPQRLTGATKVRHYDCIALGRPYAEMAAELDAVAEETGVAVAGFHHMSAKEIAENTGLTVEEAEMARSREFDEPFFFAGGGLKEEQRFIHAAKLRGLQVSRGGRFWHLLAGCDKGRAVQQLVKLFREAMPRTRLHSVALGNSANDLPMLRAVDRAVLLPSADGELDAEALQGLPRVAQGAKRGPAGWNEAVLEMLGAG